MDAGAISHRCLCSHGYVVNKKLINNIQLKKILTQLMVTPKVDSFFAEFSPPSSYPIFLHDKENYYLPRYWAEKVFGPPKFLRLPKGDPISISIKFDPQPHQLEAWDKLKQQFRPNIQLGGGGVLSLPCGYGKTYLAIRTAAHLSVKTLVIVHQEFFLDQWKKAIEQFSDANVGIIQGKIVDVEGKDIVIGMLQSISSKREYGNLFDQFGFVIVDEVHHIGSEKFSRALPKIHTRYMLGLSATPKRKDGTSNVFYNTIGPLFHQEKRKSGNTVKVVQVYINSKLPKYKRVTMRSPSGKIRTNTKKMSINLTECAARNKLIIGFLDHIMTDPNRQVLMLSEVINNLHMFGKHYDANPVTHVVKDDVINNDEHKPLFSTIGKSTCGYYYGRNGENKAACRKRRETTAQSQLVLGTSQLAKEGLDIPTLNCLVFASPPGSDVDQAVGRILRKYMFDTPPLVLDLVDNCGNFALAATSRVAYYRDMEYQFVKGKTITLTENVTTQNINDIIESIYMDPCKPQPIETVPTKLVNRKVRKCLLYTAKTPCNLPTKPQNAKPIIKSATVKSKKRMWIPSQTSINRTPKLTQTPIKRTVIKRTTNRAPRFTQTSAKHTPTPKPKSKNLRIKLSQAVLKKS